MNSCSSASLLWMTSKPLGSCCCFAPAPGAIISFAPQLRPSPPSLRPNMTLRSPVVYVNCWGNPSSQQQHLAERTFHLHSAALGCHLLQCLPPQHIGPLGRNNCPTSQPNCYHVLSAPTQHHTRSRPHLMQLTPCRAPTGTPQPG